MEDSLSSVILIYIKGTDYFIISPIYVLVLVRIVCDQLNVLECQTGPLVF